MRTLVDTRPATSQAPAAETTVCHLLDDQDRALCGASIAGRVIHDQVDCFVEDHPRCVVCEGLGGLPPVSLQDWYHG